MKRLLVIIITLIFFSIVFAQTNGLKIYDVDDGLPSSEVHRVFFDKSGRMWICTDRGIAYYDSYKFTKIKSINNDLVFLDGYCDKSGDCWFKTFNNCIYKLKNDKLVLMCDLNKALGINLKNVGTNYTNIKDTLLVLVYNGTHPHKLFKIYKSSLQVLGVSKLDNLIEARSVNYKLFLKGESMMGLFLVDFNKEKVQQKYSMGATEFLFKRNIDTISFNYNTTAKVFVLDSNNWLIQSSLNLYLLNVKSKSLKELGIAEYDKGPLNWAKLIDGKLYYSTSFNHFRYIDIKTTDQYELDMLNKYMITSFAVDSEGNFWLSTLNNGLIKVPILQIANHKLESNITSLLLSDKKLFVGTKTGEFGELIGSNFRIIGEKKSAVKNIYKVNESEILVQGSKFNINSRYLIDNNRTVNWVGENFIIDGQFYGLGSGSIIKFDLKVIENRKLIVKFPKRIHSVMLLKGNLYFGFDDELVFFEFDTKKQIQLLPTSFRITSIKPFNNYLILTTLGDGVYIFDPKSKKVVKKIRIEEGLSANITYTSIVQNDSTFWVGSNNGINRIILDKNLRLSDIAYFDRSNGLPSNEINCFEISDEQLYIGTTKGLGIINIKNLKIPNYKPKVSINYFNVISDTTNSGALKSEFKYNENNIKISFSAFIVSKTLTKPTYLYALLMDNPSDTQWIATDETTLQFTNLDPGDYVFVVKAQARFGGFGPITAYNFKVVPHFTQTLWFKGLIVLFALGVLFLFFYLRLQNVRNKAKFNQAIKTAQLDSLRNQMNPHFIFNALNSVQSLIYSNNPDAAGDFLGKISRMFRDALEFSRTTTISLKVELFFIERYLEIEKLRFPEKLEYKITVDENLQEELENFQLPPLLMQPLVENSVKHGLKNMDGKGLVEVSVKKEGDSLVYIVEDNCGGIPEKSSSTHTSRGLSIINQRIDILNQLEGNENPYSFEFINMPGKGVRAVLRVPID